MYTFLFRYLVNDSITRPQEQHLNQNSMVRELHNQGKIVQVYYIEC